MSEIKNRKGKKGKPGDRLKYEIAKELGLSEKISTKGWGGLTAAETGRIGGIIAIRRREQKCRALQK